MFETKREIQILFQKEGRNVMGQNAKVLLNFVLQGGSFFRIMMDRPAAKEFIKKYAVGEFNHLPLMYGESEDGPWAIERSAIQALHLMEIQVAANPGGAFASPLGTPRMRS